MRGNAILARQDLHITHIGKAPSGTAKRSEREQFYNVELPILFSEYTHPPLVGGNFNCILQPVDSTGHFINSNALAEIVRGLRLTDMWEQDPQRPTFTHFSPTVASRLDCISYQRTTKGGKLG